MLKELANQQIEFDLDDGVSVNYEKFEGALAVIKELTVNETIMNEIPYIHDQNS